jgi:hypothetical protein
LERPENPWDLKNCRQKQGETLCKYIRRFSKECNALANISGTDMIGASLTGTACGSLVHKLARKSPRTTKELLDITTNHALREVAVGAIFDYGKGKAKHGQSTGEGSSNRLGKKNKRNSGFPHSRRRLIGR